jgi:hypothetical protein
VAEVLVPVQVVPLLVVMVVQGDVVK